jgi:hypothetical protein
LFNNSLATYSTAIDRAGLGRSKQVVYAASAYLYGGLLMFTCILIAWGSVSLGFLFGTMWFGLCADKDQRPAVTASLIVASD